MSSTITPMIAIMVSTAPRADSALERATARARRMLVRCSAVVLKACVKPLPPVSSRRPTSNTTRARESETTLASFWACTMKSRRPGRRRPCKKISIHWRRGASALRPLTTSSRAATGEASTSRVPARREVKVGSSCSTSLQNLRQRPCSQVLARMRLSAPPPSASTQG